MISLGNFEVIVAIVNFGMGSKMLNSAKKYGIPGGTIMIARGTARRGVLDYWGLGDSRKEMILMVCTRAKAYEVVEKLGKEYAFHKPNHGIAFTVAVEDVIGCSTFHKSDEHEEEEKSMYQVITTIVDRGKAEDVVDAATSAGAKGGTIISARGAGTHEHCKVFSVNIEPEKEIVMILAENEAVEAITEAIKVKMNIEELGNGLVFVQDVNKTYGIYK